MVVVLQNDGDDVNLLLALREGAEVEVLLGVTDDETVAWGS
jgi:hypothetical protein